MAVALSDQLLHANCLLKDGYELRLFEPPRVEPYRQFTNNEKMEWLTGDFMSIHDVSNAIEGVDVVLHLISTTLPKSSNDDMVYDGESNLVPTLQLLNAMVAKAVHKIVFISSGGTIYGTPTHIPIAESHPTEPLVSYGVTKLASEKYLLIYQHLYGIKAIILRVANPFGERQRIETAQGAVGVFLSKAIQNQPLEIWGDGTVTRDYLYISDVARAFVCAVNYDGPKSVFNISSGIGTSLNELIDMLERVLGHLVVRHYQPGRSFDVPVSILDNSLARKELGWKPQVELEGGILKTANWMQKVLTNGK